MWYFCRLLRLCSFAEVLEEYILFFFFFSIIIIIITTADELIFFFFFLKHIWNSLFLPFYPSSFSSSLLFFLLSIFLPTLYHHHHHLFSPSHPSPSCRFAKRCFLASFYPAPLSSFSSLSLREFLFLQVSRLTSLIYATTISTHLLLRRFLLRKNI